MINKWNIDIARGRRCSCFMCADWGGMFKLGCVQYFGIVSGSGF